MTFSGMLQSLWFGTLIIFSAAIDDYLNVVNSSDQCNSFDFNLNHVKKIDTFRFNGYDSKASCSPEANRLIPVIYFNSSIGQNPAKIAGLRPEPEVIALLFYF